MPVAISPEPGQNQPEPEAKIGAMGRVIGAFTSPKATFEDIARKPSWIAPMLILIILNLGISGLLATKVDWRSVVTKQMEASPASASLPEDQKAQRIEMGAKIAPMITWVAGILGIPIVALIITLVYWLGFNLIKGAGIKFGTAFGITVHALLPSAISIILTIIILYLKPAGDIVPEPGKMAATSLYAFLPANAAKWLQALGASLEIFWIWCMVLLAIGYSAANPRKIQSGYAIVFGIWLVWVLIKVGWAAAM